MLPGYQKAGAEGGSGMFERMKHHVQSHVAASKGLMFGQASEELANQLVAIEVTASYVLALVYVHNTDHTALRAL